MNTTDLNPEHIKIGDIVTNPSGSKIWIILDKRSGAHAKTYMFSYMSFDNKIENSVFDTKIRVLNEF